MTDEQTFIRNLADALGETDAQPLLSLTAIVKRLGRDFATTHLRRTQEVEAAGGMLTQDETRRRTPGGVFFHLVKHTLYEQEQFAAIHELFPAAAPDERPTPPARPLPRVWHGRQPDQASINTIIDHFLGPPPDLYRRSIHPKTGATTLFFFFPDAARGQYQEQIAQAAGAAQVDITVAPQVHQGQMQQAARDVLPASLTVKKVSIHQEQRTVHVRVLGAITPAALADAQAAFTARTAWTLAVDIPPTAAAPSAGAAPAAAPPLAWVRPSDAHPPLQQPVPGWLPPRGLLICWRTDAGTWADAQGPLPHPPRYWLQGAGEHLPPDAHEER